MTRMQTVAELVISAKQKADTSFAKLAGGRRDRAAYLQRLATEETVGWPHLPSTIRDLAEWTGTTQRQVVLAYATSQGLDVGPATLADTLPPGTDELPPHAHQMIWDLARSLVVAAQTGRLS